MVAAVTQLFMSLQTQVGGSCVQAVCRCTGHAPSTPD
jgi:hypothetical protein